MTKVHIARLGALSMILAAFLMAGCDQEQAPPNEEPTRDRGQFGDAYQVLTNEHPDAPDEPPVIESDSLRVLVAYSGGCENHDFDFDYEVEGDTTRLWLHHNDGGDNCEAMIYDRLSFPVPNEALESEAVYLENPNDPAPFILRWP